jgi:hypothetical protein
VRVARTRPSGIVTLLTDFGVEDPYVGIVKGVILGISPRAFLIDLTHAIPPQDVLRGALRLESAYRLFPRGTVHLAVVDPGVGTGRRPLVVRAGGHVFVGPDNGLLSFLFDQPGSVAVTPSNRAYWRLPVSRTFHARDVFAPVAAHCSLGVPLGRLGPRVGDPVRLRWPRPRRLGRRVVGEVLLADRFGNLLTNVREDDLPAPPEACEVQVAGRRLGPLVGTYGLRSVGALGALVDSSGRVEIFVRNGSARARLRAGPGTRVSLSAAPRSTRSRRPAKLLETARSTPGLVSSPLPPRPSSRPRRPSSGPPTGSRSRTSRSP